MHSNLGFTSNSPIGNKPMKIIFLFFSIMATACAQTVLMPQGMVDNFDDVVRKNPSLKIVGYSGTKDALSKIDGADAYLGGVNAALMEAGRDLRWVHIFSAGIERYADFPQLSDGTVTLTNFKIYQGPEIADHAFALLLGLTRNMPAYVRAQDDSVWKKKADDDLPMIELRGKTMLVVGYGGIGTQVAERAHAFGMEVHAIDVKDIPLTQTLAGSGKPDELDEFLSKADVVVSCVPHTPETDKMFGAGQFAKMKDGTYFINVSRGKVVDTDALVAALEDGKLSGAGLDVVDPEPLPSESPLWKMKNVIITPHDAGVSDARADRQKALLASNLERFAKGLILNNEVSAEKGY